MTRVLSVAALQVLVLLGMAGYHEYVQRTAPTFRIPLAPSDPFDVLRGRYFVLNPADRFISATSPHLSRAEVDRFLAGNASFAGEAEVGFCPVEALYRVCALRRTGEPAPAGTAAAFWSPARLELDRSDDGFRLQVNLRLDRFFIPNQVVLPGRETEAGWELEVSHRPGRTLLPRRLYFKGTPIEGAR
ncbi:MAG: GDYXXLXY domain-containing protein [Acidobacteria bacterium]|nr:GDYXXLXY domain-containing protein [Acidobacteriota bacterium]